MNTTLKRGDIVRRYNRNKGMYQYGVVADTLVFLENKCVTCVIYREKSQTFCTWTDVEEVFMRIEQESLPSRFCFLSDISKIFAHVRIDYSVIDDGDIKTGYNLPLIGVLESVCLIDAIDRSAYISKNVFAEHPEVFLNECEYEFKLQWENCEEADVVFYRV